MAGGAVAAIDTCPTDATRCRFIAESKEIAATLDIARRSNLWIVADEISGRMTYNGVRAPSPHDAICGDDKILFVQTLSKNWAMTGFRIGWLGRRRCLRRRSRTSSSSPRRACRSSPSGRRSPFGEGEAFLASQIERCRRSHDILCAGLSAIGRVRYLRRRSISSAQSTAVPIPGRRRFV